MHFFCRIYTFFVESTAKKKPAKSVQKPLKKGPGCVVSIFWTKYQKMKEEKTYCNFKIYCFVFTYLIGDAI